MDFHASQFVRPQGSNLGCMPFSSNQAFNSLAAMLLQKHGMTGADPLSANSRSGSPYLGPQADANNATGALDAQAMQLPAAARLLPPPAVPLAAAMQRHTACGTGPSCGDSQCSHNSAHTDEPVMGTPLSLFMATPAQRPASPTPLAHPSVQPQRHPKQQPAPAAAPAAAATPPAHVEAPEAAPAAAPAAAAPAPLPVPYIPAGSAGSSKSWLYQLVTCPYLFKPCPQCSSTHSGREVLITYFDPDAPAHGYCTYCPQRASRPRLLQIRRSTYHEVVKAADVSRLTDVSGIQHYVINGAKVLFLRPRPQPRPPKGVVAPARCAVDGRQLMDAHSSYCSLRCKLEVEDKVFATNYPSAMEEMEAAAAAAEEGGDAGLAGTYHRQGGHEGRRVVVPSNKRSASAMAAPAVAEHHDDSSDEGDVAGGRSKRQRNLPSKFANTVLGGSAPYQAAGAPGGSSHQRSQQHQHRHVHGPIKGGFAGLQAGDDTAASDQLAGQGLNVAGVTHMAKGTQHAASPCTSEDSGLSSTCNQRWHHKRKVMQPCRAPLE